MLITKGTKFVDYKEKPDGHSLDQVNKMNTTNGTNRLHVQLIGDRIQCDNLIKNISPGCNHKESLDKSKLKDILKKQLAYL